MDLFNAMQRSTCDKCGLTVFLAERQEFGGRTFHRKCLACARCGMQLSPGDFYETEIDGEFCCEICPDEEGHVVVTPVTDEDTTIGSVADRIALFQRMNAELQKKSLSDEEKRTSLQRLAATTITNSATEEDDDDDDESEADEDTEGSFHELVTDSATSTLERPADDNNQNLLDRDELEAFVRDEIELIIAQALAKIAVEEDDKPKPVPRTKRAKSGGDCSTPKTPQTPSPSDFVFPPPTTVVAVAVPSEVKIELTEVPITPSKPERPPKPPQISKPPIKPRPEVVKKIEYPTELNPFGDDDEPQEDESSHAVVEKSKESTNPFGSDDDEEEEGPVIPKKVSTNPFGSDDEDDDVMTRSAETRSLSHSSIRRTPVPTPRKLGVESNRQTLSPGSDFHGSSLSLASDGTWRKKKRAPAPPLSLLQTSLSNSRPENLDYESENSASSGTLARRNKKRRAPLPPTLTTSTPLRKEDGERTIVKLTTELLESSQPEEMKSMAVENSVGYRQEIFPFSEESATSPRNSGEMPLNKSDQGKWKRRKRMAPARPMEVRSSIKAMSPEAIKREIEDMKIQQIGLEKQGVKLEQRIRDKCEGSHTNQAANTKEVEELIMQLFDVVNEKNDLFRRQSELMYMRRQHRLELEQIELDKEIRRLMSLPHKTDAEKTREEQLIARLLEVVQQRNEVVETMETNRIREVQEDLSIRQSIEKHAARFEKLAQKAQSKFGKSKEKKKDKKKANDGTDDPDGESKTKKKKKKNVFNRLISTGKTKTEKP